MSIFLPVAGISISIWVLIAAGAFVGFLSGLLGVGGGFLLTPILMLVGIPPTVAAASDSCQIVAASSSAVAAHFRLGNVDFKMGITLLAGGLTGAGLGVQVIKVLRVMGSADSLIAITYIVVLGAVGGSMFLASLKNLRRGPMATKAHRAPAGGGRLQRLPLQVYFERSNVRHSLLVPFLLCTVVGVLASIMGVGGAFMMVPMMVYLLGMPAHVAVGTSLFQTLFTCAGVTYMQSTANHTVDLVLALMLAAGSTIGAQIGARLTRFLRGDQLLIILATLALVVAGKMVFDVLVTPKNLLVPTVHAGLHLHQPLLGMLQAFIRNPGIWAGSA
ncbi:MAG TPA: sulfite exporter TauE/SafE family protein [Bryobacteraceae bacterium]|nr:sulfite exporter TauE/SafE family protein [Bryobacteraceae bacterium]